MTFVPLITSIVSFIFAIFVLDQVPRPSSAVQRIWCVGLLMYAVSSGAEFAAGAGDITIGVYKTWYLFGAILVAAWLGMGTLYLLFKRSTANIIMGSLATVSILCGDSG